MAGDQVTFFVQVGRACTVCLLFFSLFPQVLSSYRFQMGVFFSSGFTGLFALSISSSVLLSLLIIHLFSQNQLSLAFLFHCWQCGYSFLNPLGRNLSLSAFLTSLSPIALEGDPFLIRRIWGRSEIFWRPWREGGKEKISQVR